jgi:hypothetical protein
MYMTAYYPFGKPIQPTEEQAFAQQKKFERYDYYGIPYGDFDTSKNGEGYTSDEEIDREKARILIMNNEIIPKDLEIRLLRYKQQEQSENQ